MVNPAANAGRTTDLVPTIEAAARAAGAETSIHVPASPAATSELLRRLVADRRERIIVAGGDGMVHLAVNELAGSDTILGLVPCGTGNDSASGLGLPSGVEQAVGVAFGPAQPIDLIKCGDRYACSVATLGFSVAVNARADAMRFPKGGAKYTFASLIEIPRLRTHALSLTIDEVEMDVAVNLLAIANTPMFGGGMRVAPDADPSDGLLDVVVIGPASRGAFVRLLPTVFSGRHVNDPRVTVHRATRILVDGPALDGPALEVRADGERVGELPIEIAVMPSALQLAGATL